MTSEEHEFLHVEIEVGRHLLLEHCEALGKDPRRKLGQFGAVEQDHAGAAQNTGQAAKEGGLASPVRPSHGEKFSPRDGELHPR
jgi:hypothetical protein